MELAARVKRNVLGGRVHWHLVGVHRALVKGEPKIA